MNKLQQIEEFKAEFLTRLEYLKKECEVSKVWKPVYGETVYYLNGKGSLETYAWDDKSKFLKLAYDRGLTFRTEQEARAYDNYRLAYMRVTRKLRELEGDWFADWSDISQMKSFFYDHPSERLSHNCFGSVKSLPTERYSTKQAIEWVIKHMADDCKCILGVK